MGDQGDQSPSPRGRDHVKKRKKTIIVAAADSHFVSGLAECEKKTVTWEIRNIAELMEMSDEDLEDNGITFDVGQSVGIPATWHFSFVRFPSAGWVGTGSSLELSTESEAKTARASYTCKLSCDGKMIAYHDFDPYHFHDSGGWGFPFFTQESILEKTDNGKKALKATLTVKVFSEKGSSKPMEVKAPKGKLKKEDTMTAISDFAKMLESGDGADVEIKVPNEIGGEVDASSYTRKVHKGVLMSRSSVFSKMFEQESEMVEAKKGEVVIKDISPKGLDVLLHYLYTGKALKDWLKVPGEILNAAEKYDLGGLKQYCVRNLMAAVSTSNAIALYQVAKLHNLSVAKNAIAEFISNNTRAVLDDDDDISDEERVEED